MVIWWLNPHPFSKQNLEPDPEEERKERASVWINVAQANNVQSNGR